MNLFKRSLMVVISTLLVGGVTILRLSAGSQNVITENESDVAWSEPQEKTENSAVEAETKKDSAPAKEESKQQEKKKQTQIIKFSQPSLSLGKGESYTLKTNIKAEKLQSDNEKIIKIVDGKAKAQGIGSATVTAFDAQGNSTKCKLTVKEEPDSVAFDRYDLTLGVGESYTLSAVIPEGCSAAGRSFSSSDSDVLKVTKSGWKGEFKALKPGTAYAIVKLYNGREASCEITVKEAPEKVIISRPEVTLGVGEHFKLTSGIPAGTGSAYRKFRSSDDSILQMTTSDWNGKFKTLKEGSATVTVRTYNGKESTCKVTVKKAPESVRLSKDTLELKVGQRYTLTCDVNEGAASSLRTFRSSDSSVIEMKKTTWAGEFITVGEGTAWVTVRTYNGKEKSCKITVKERSQSDISDDSVSHSSSSGSTTGGGHTTAPDGTPWSSDTDDTVVFVDDQTISLTNNVAVLDPGDRYSIYLSSLSSGSISFSSGDSSVATVDDNGTVTALSCGNTNIIIKDNNGKTAKVEIIVLGDRGSCIYPEISSICSVLDSAKLSPVKTNYAPIDNMVDNIFSRILHDGMSNSEKVQACYDYLAQNCTYGYDGYKAVNIDSYYNDEDKEIAEFSYCILKDQLGTCENFSAAFVVMMRRLGYAANQIYGNVAMSAGGYDGHYWTDVEINGKHYLFDPQVERNCLGENNYVMHYFFGMDPENNYSMYRYLYMTCVHGFKGSPS